MIYDYATDYLSGEHVADIIECFEQILKSPINTTACRLGDIEFITEQSCEQTREWNRTLILCLFLWKVDILHCPYQQREQNMVILKCSP